MTTVVDSASDHPDIVWPTKRRELVQFVIDSRPWNDFVFRDDDIVIGTWSKSGTTWMQQIVGQLIFGGPDAYSCDASPWIEFRLGVGDTERAIAQTHRRFLKTHLPIDAIVYSPRAKYLFVGRDVRDTYWSWHNHHMSFTEASLAFISSLYPDQPPVGYPNPDIRLAFHDWLDNDAYPTWPFWSHSQGWYDARNLPNLKLVHFADLKADLSGQIAAIAEFLEIEVDPATLPTIVAHCSFEYMREQAIKRKDTHRAFKAGSADFFHKGTNGRWRDVLTPEDQARLDQVIAANLTPDCAHWLATGHLPAGERAKPW